MSIYIIAYVFQTGPPTIHEIIMINAVTKHIVLDQSRDYIIVVTNEQQQLGILHRCIFQILYSLNLFQILKPT